MYKSYFKRILDFIAALVLLLIFSPLIIVCFILLLFVNKGNALFFQIRPGYQSTPFTILKFKTMHDGKDINGNLLPDEVRLTKIGKIVRGLSIDELLQLINVIKGDMSLVGPRPLLTQYLARYTPEQARRHNVRPGITGWAQVNGRNALRWEEKFKLDVEYVEKVSFLLDMKILWLTLFNVFQRKGISADGHATMEEFRGSEG
ncbi:sugar transferase [Aquirufa antheringensis]|uniref:sugar transferase n=1 Tax=Aquirufa antheringensis TaxID=2516559 RepID=UPI0022A958A8|nr:sugar transferase [Aquirufa antheringensis]MCZ2490072.1 sugar transferase [Aquirufa antheringensis]